ncbi:MAG: hypothetical protein ACE5EY_14015, partial [Anaerolineae bacterium]
MCQLFVAMQNAGLHEQVQNHAHDLEQEVTERTQALTEANKQLQGLDRLKSKLRIVCLRWLK